jgi:hypothetical protein
LAARIEAQTKDWPFAFNPFVDAAIAIMSRCIIGRVGLTHCDGVAAAGVFLRGTRSQF